MGDKLRGIYVKDGGQRFCQKKSMQTVSLLIHWHKPTNMDNVPTHPKPIAKPVVSSRRPHKMMRTSSYIRVSELIELD